jgi:hypothetical protein
MWLEVEVSVGFAIFWLVAWIERFPILGIVTLPHMAATAPRSGTTE